VLLACGDTVRLDDLPPSFQTEPPGVVQAQPGDLRHVRREAQKKATADVERCAIVGFLEKSGWNVERAAKLAGYSRAQFYRLMQKHAISRPT